MTAGSRGVRNPMKISYIGFLKTEPNRTDLKIQKPKTRFTRFGFQKPTGSLGTVFHVVSFTMQRDRINSQFGILGFFSSCRINALLVPSHFG